MPPRRPAVHFPDISTRVISSMPTYPIVAQKLSDNTRGSPLLKSPPIRRPLPRYVCLTLHISSGLQGGLAVGSPLLPGGTTGLQSIHGACPSAPPPILEVSSDQVAAPLALANRPP